MAKGKLGYKVRTITCVVCSKVVTDHMRSGQKYCSLKCYRNSPRPQRKTGKDIPCDVCGTLAYFSGKRLNQKNFFCSVEHANEWQSRNKDAYTCKTCGTEFLWSPSRKRQTNPTYCTVSCRDADPARSERLIRMNVEQSKGKTTKLELAGYGILDRIGVDYERQHLLFDRFCVDAAFPDLRLVVQFDGDYWHGHPVNFPNPDKRQKKRMWIDKGQDAFLRKRDYQIIRIWEFDMKSNPDSIHLKLSDAIYAAVDRNKSIVASSGSLSLAGSG